MALKIKQITKSLDQEINLFEPGQKLVGIDIGSKLLKIVLTKETPVGTRLLGIGMAEVAPPVEKESEEDTQKRISQALKSAIAQVGSRIKKITIIANIPSLNIKNISLPAMPEEELKESVKWEMEQNINYPINTATLDFLISGETIRAGSKNLELEVVSAQTEEIKKEMEFYSNNQLRIESINISTFCLWNVFQKSNQWKEDDTIALVDIGSKRTTINIFNNNILRFNREILFGGDTITDSLARELNIPAHEAEELKIKYGLSDKSSHIDRITEPLKQLAAQIDRSFGYYKAQFHIERIDRVVLYGGSSKLINIEKFLTEELGIFVEVGNPFNGLLFNPQAFSNMDEFVSFFPIAIGAALNSGSVKRINLLPLEFRKEDKNKVKKFLLRAVPAVFIGILVLIYASLINTEKKLAETNQARQTIINSWKEQNKLESKLKFLNSINSTQKSWIEIFKGISSVIPEGVWLNHISLAEQSKQLIITGAGKNNLLIIDLVRKLESLPFFNSVKLESVEEISVDNSTIISFKISIEKK